MKKYLILFFSLVSCITWGQNLVPNGSFEIHTSCPTSGSQLNLCPPWYNPTAGTPDYFNSCGSIGFEVPLNVWGYQYAKTGNAYAEIMAYGSSSGSFREYIQVQLSDTLISGRLYCVEFYVSHVGVSSFSTYTPVAVTEIGLLFSSNAIITSTTTPLPYIPQIVSPTGVYLNDTTSWTKISAIYTATGGEHYITIGNFKNDASTDTITVANPSAGNPQAYYFVDDISIINCDSLAGITNYNNNSTFNLFPNPNDGTMTLQYNLKQVEKASFKLFDVTGKLINEKILNPNEKQIQIITNLDKGIYLYQIIVDDRVLKSDKVVIY